MIAEITKIKEAAMSDHAISRRGILMMMGATAFVPASAHTDDRVIRVAKTATCGCCTAWIEHLEAEGFTVEAGNMEHDALARLKAELGLTPKHTSCHTAVVNGYVIEGHVPASDIRALLTERPSGLGLSVPGMPIGSPGMEMGNTVEPYDTLLIGYDGSAEVFRSHR